MIQYDCAIVGGGLAGLQAAIQLGRYRHKIVVADAGGGRSNLCRCYHNILGWPDGISGKQLRQLGREHAERLGVEFMDAVVKHAEQKGEDFVLTASDGRRIRASRLLIAAGVQDRIPMQQKLAECLGLTVFVCPDCDGYEVRDKRVLVLGSGNPGAAMSLTLRYWTSDIIYINHDGVSIHEEHAHQLEKAGIITVADSIDEVIHSEGRLQGVTLGQGTYIEGGYGFTAFGGNHVHSELADQLGVALTDNRHIEVDPRTKMTNVAHVWAAGDVTSHSEQAVIAIGDGSQAAIWIHKSLLVHS
ncbi:NAD(P)/FAD-dependent oxidoreductase [Paenibacillus oenotherae]|uniref:NAD(P)/FAD-dependent oxidoreductase n=1 Tax=Paenibacillus oenotherae TaxID=1435645 RepID=A0ABS7DBH5_9BACL|nr:NAD(P)/FAD-dependent oxidoreductase [Paenibacillus oenotherae]MBW7477129.1 NAD(P)/FAD-dependent oxidoreductase [Paenibacillus oenotherae]